MANYATLKSAIQQVIKTNGNNEITGALLQQSLLAMINSLGGYYQFAGIATPSTNPGTPDQNVFYIGGAGTYSNFSSLVIPTGYIGVLKYNGTWTLETVQAGDVNAVKFVAQTLTDNQKTQARTNIEAASNEQVSQLEAKVDELQGDVGEKTKTEERIDLTDGISWYDGHTVYATNGAISSSSVNSLTDWLYLGDNEGKTITYTRKKITSESTEAGMAFYDEQGNFISGQTFITGADENGYVLDNIVIPSGAKNARFAFGTADKASFKAEIIIIRDDYVSGLGKRVQDIEPKVTELEEEVGDSQNDNIKTYIHVAEWTDGAALVATGGGIGTTGVSGVNSVTDYMDVSRYVGKNMTYTRKRVTSSISLVGMVFYDSEKEPVSGELAVRGVESGSADYELSTIEIPQGAAYARFTFTTENKANFEAYVYVQEKVFTTGLGKRVQDLESETGELEQDIVALGDAISAVGLSKTIEIFPQTTMGELQNGAIATSYSSEYAVINVVKYRGCKLLVNNIHSATGESRLLDNTDGVIQTFSGVGTSVGIIDIPNNASKLIVSNDFESNSDFYISVPEELEKNDGLIFGENFLSDYDEGDFSQFNGTVINSKGLQLSGTGASNGLILNRVVALDDWSLVADIMTDDNTEVVSLGTKMTQPGITHHSTRVSVDFYAGAMSLYNNQSGTLVTSGTISSIVNGNIYTIKLERINRAIYATVVNRKTGASVSINSPDGAEGSGNEGINPAGKMFDSPIFYVESGLPYLQNIYATCLRNAKVFFVGDSITAGAHTTVETSWAQKAAEFFGESITGGRGSGQLFCCINQLRSLLPVVSPKAVVVTIGTNFTSGISKSGYKGLFLAIINMIRHYGAIPIINNVCACDSRKTNLTTINEVVNELKQIGCRFDLATSLNNNWADGQDSQYYYTDNVHLNVAGNTLLYNIITTQLGWLKNL